MAVFSAHAWLKAAGPWEIAVGIKPALGRTAANAIRALVLVPTWIGVGALGGGLYGTVCGGVYDLLHWEFSRTFSWGLWLAVAGATAGAIAGACGAIDRVLNARSAAPHREKAGKRLAALSEPRARTAAETTPRPNDRAQRFSG
jgi:hypothetical protein